MIPAVGHFVWFGRRLPWVHALGVRSAARRGAFEKVVLHHADELEPGEGTESLRGEPRIECRRLEAGSLFEPLGAPAEPLRRLLGELTAPAARANVVRAAILAAEGGVYLDTDTVTVRSFRPLLEAGAFCGLERVVLPVEVVRSRSPATWAAAGVRLAVRDLLRRLPDGHLGFRRVERFYPAAVNNAVLGAEAGHPFVLDLLRRMVELPDERRLVRFALGTHLLADAVAAANGCGPVVHPPAVFYPLAPEISEHWFREGPRVRLERVVAAETVSVHWYASVRTARLAPRIDPAYVRAHAARQLFSALAAPFA
ncbi:MAG: glycosyl transferase [Deltaproteobacteria bacterium]|nr:glycosyl transferase [Deltaproteobacteria bacterium]